MNSKQWVLIASGLATSGLSYPLWRPVAQTVETKIVEQAEAAIHQRSLVTSRYPIETLPETRDTTDTGGAISWRDTGSDTGGPADGHLRFRIEDTGDTASNDTGLGDENESDYEEFRVTVTDPDGNPVPYPVRITTLCSTPNYSTYSNLGRTDGQATMVRVRLSIRPLDQCQVRAYRAGIVDPIYFGNEPFDPSDGIPDQVIILD